MLVLCVLAAVFGAEDSGAAAAVPLALGGLAVVGLVALAYYFLRQARRSRAETLSRRAALLRQDSARAGLSGRADVEAPRSPGRGGGGGFGGGGLMASGGFAPGDADLQPLVITPKPAASAGFHPSASPGFGGDGRVAPVPRSSYRAPLPAPSVTYGGLTDPEARMQARLRMAKLEP